MIFDQQTFKNQKNKKNKKNKTIKNKINKNPIKNKKINSYKNRPKELLKWKTPTVLIILVLIFTFLAMPFDPANLRNTEYIYDDSEFVPVEPKVGRKVYSAPVVKI